MAFALPIVLASTLAGLQPAAAGPVRRAVGTERRTFDVRSAEPGGLPAGSRAQPSAAPPRLPVGEPLRNWPAEGDRRARGAGYNARPR